MWIKVTFKVVCWTQLWGCFNMKAAEFLEFMLKVSVFGGIYLPKCSDLSPKRAASGSLTAFHWEKNLKWEALITQLEREESLKSPKETWKRSFYQVSRREKWREDKNPTQNCAEIILKLVHEWLSHVEMMDCCLHGEFWGFLLIIWHAAHHLVIIRVNEEVRKVPETTAWCVIRKFVNKSRLFAQKSVGMCFISETHQNHKPQTESVWFWLI